MSREEAPTITESIDAATDVDELRRLAHQLHTDLRRARKIERLAARHASECDADVAEAEARLATRTAEVHRLQALLARQHVAVHDARAAAYGVVERLRRLGVGTEIVAEPSTAARLLAWAADWLEADLAKRRTVEGLIEASSFGTRDAVAIRATVSEERARAVVARTGQIAEEDR